MPIRPDAPPTLDTAAAARAETAARFNATRGPRAISTAPPLDAVADIRERQRAVLTATFPAWTITYGTDLFGGLTWIAELRDAPSLELATAGVERRVQRGDPIELMTALTWQIETASRRF
ncbi:hypothetical protein [Streptomyces sp.]|uniref:hypothetical protein n=1 Tax=Streptomyces sp. TaxID=1931 RepID=UPI002F92C132